MWIFRCRRARSGPFPPLLCDCKQVTSRSSPSFLVWKTESNSSPWACCESQMDDNVPGHSSLDKNRGADPPAGGSVQGFASGLHSVPAAARGQWRLHKPELSGGLVTQGHFRVALKASPCLPFLFSPQMILVAIFSETGFFDYCAVKVGLMWHFNSYVLIDIFVSHHYIFSKITI